MDYKIKNWHKFQHFKDRRPPWIKLYRDLLDRPDFHALSGESAKVLIMLWLLASEDKTKEGLLPDIKEISFRLRMPESKIKQALTALDIKWISSRYQDGPTETETEAYKEETEKRQIPYTEIINHFNETFSKSYRPESKETQKLIKARWEDGFRLEDFKAVHEKMHSHWNGDSKMSEFLRPHTLYTGKFESYLNRDFKSDPWETW